MVPSDLQTMSFLAPGMNCANQPALPIRKQALMKKRISAGYRLAFVQSMKNVSYTINKM